MATLTQMSVESGLAETFLAPLTAYEIIEIFRAATLMPTQAQLDALIAKGCSPWSLAGAPNTGELGIAFGKIERTGDSRFDFAEGDGERALLVPAINEFGDVVDIICATKSGFVGTWDGRCPVLGIRNAIGARIDEAVTIHETVLGWLVGERAGLVVIDHARAAAALDGLGPFRAAGGVAHGLRLQAILTPRPPKIVVPSARLRQAA